MNQSYSKLYIIAITTLVILIIVIIGISIHKWLKRRRCSVEHTIPIHLQHTIKAITRRDPLVVSFIDEYDVITKIPKIIIQTNEKEIIPLGMYDATNTILYHNPEYTYIYFNDKDARDYILTNYSKRILKAYDRLIPGAYKADLFRYCVLYKMGGVYIDMGMISKTPLRNIIKTDDTFISPEDSGGFGVYNAFICCVPDHPIIKHAIDICVDNVEKLNYGVDSLDVTGPRVLEKAMRFALNKADNWKPLPDKTYDNEIRIICHHKHPVHKFDDNGECKTTIEEGNIHDGKTFLFITRYPTYRSECKWYNTKPHYGILWKNKSIYNF